MFLHLNGVPAERAENEAVHRLVMSVAEGDDDVAPIAVALRRVVEGGPTTGP